jgi:hypothetical protein
MIVVLPDSKTIYNGSMYSSSVTTGDFEKCKFTASAPPPFVDQYIGDLEEYRAIAIDVGDRDSLRVDTTKLHNILDN